MSKETFRCVLHDKTVQSPCSKGVEKHRCKPGRCGLRPKKASSTFRRSMSRVFPARPTSIQLEYQSEIISKPGQPPGQTFQRNEWEPPSLDEEETKEEEQSEDEEWEDPTAWMWEVLTRPDETPEVGFGVPDGFEVIADEGTPVLGPNGDEASLSQSIEAPLEELRLEPAGKDVLGGIPVEPTYDIPGPSGLDFAPPEPLAPLDPIGLLGSPDLPGSEPGIFPFGDEFMDPLDPLGPWPSPEGGFTP